MLSNRSQIMNGNYLHMGFYLQTFVYRFARIFTSRNFRERLEEEARKMILSETRED